MNGTAATIALALFVGWPLAALARARGKGVRAGLAILLGFGAVALILYGLSALGIAWSRPAILGAGLAVAAAAWGARARVPDDGAAGGPRPARGSIPFLAVAAVVVIGHALYSTAGPRIDSDFHEIWGLKGRVFYESGGVDWRFLRSETTFHNHPDYPPVLPLLFAAAGVMNGAWEDAELGLFGTAAGVALLLITEGVLRRRHAGSWLVGPAVLALTPLALTPWGGNADGLLLAFGAAAVLLVREGIEEGAGQALFAGSVLLGLAALTKNEGMAMIVALALALLIGPAAGRRPVAALWPSVAIAALWIVPRVVAGLETDLTVGNPFARLGGRLSEPLPLLQMLAAHAAWRPLFWIGLAVGLAATAGRALRAERLALSFVILQCLFYVGAYAASPHDIAWHVRWSWERLLSHLTFLLTAAILSAIIATLREKALIVDR